MAKKILLLIIMSAAVVCMAGCGKSGSTQVAQTTLSGGGVAFVPQTTATVSEGSTAAVPSEAPDMEQDKADSILSGVLTGTGCKAVFEEKKSVGGSDYFVYSVKDPQNGDMTQMLAVNAKSGEVVVCESASADIVSPFSDFKYYSKVSENKKDISWEGTFELDDLSVTLSPADEASFEFTISEDGKVLLKGVASANEDTADWKSQDGKEVLKFTMADADTLQMIETGSEGVSGQYTKKQ